MKNSRKFVWVLVFILSTALISAGCSAPASEFPSAGITPTVPAEAPAVAPSPTALQALVATETPEQAEPLIMDTTGALRFEIVQPESKARYRVREQLVNLDLPNDAVGETDLVTGVIVLNPDGTIDSVASKIEVDLTTLVSDQSRRDGYVRRNVLQTDQYPKAVFIPTGQTGLPFPLPESGPVDFQLSGDLTIRDVTRPVTWTVTGNVAGDRATGQAVTSFTFADFNLTQPRVPVVLSIEDQIKLELDIVLQKAGGS